MCDFKHYPTQSASLYIDIGSQVSKQIKPLQGSKVGLEQDLGGRVTDPCDGGWQRSSALQSCSGNIIIRHCELSMDPI